MNSQACEKAIKRREDEKKTFGASGREREKSISIRELFRAIHNFMLK